MSDRQATFVEACLSGTAGLADVDRFVERWHLGGDTRPLHEFLGLTPQEYAAWVEDPQTLRFILLAHAQGVSLAEAMAQAQADNASAPPESLGDPKHLADWLKRVQTT